MEQLAFTVALLGSAFLILYFTFSWDKEEHMLLRLLGSFFFIAVLILIPKSSLDYSQVCDFAVNQSITNTSTNTTTYTYDFLCATKDYGTPFIFYKLVLRFLYVFSAYVFVYLVYVIFLKQNKKFNEWMNGLVKKK